MGQSGSDYIKEHFLATTLVPTNGDDSNLTLFTENIAFDKDQAEKVYTNANRAFSIYIDNQLVSLAQSVSGISMKREVDSFNVGGEGTHKPFTVKGVSYSDVTFKKLINPSMFFINWLLGSAENLFVPRRDVTIQIIDYYDIENDGRSSLYSIVLHNAIPVAWSIDTLNIAPDQNKTLFESVTLKPTYVEIQPGTLISANA